MKKIEIKVEKGMPGKPFPHMWSTCVGAGRAKEGLMAEWQKQLGECVRTCGFRYIRFHGLLCDDMAVYKVVDGEEVYNWQYVDLLFDRLLEIGIRPFVEFGFMPQALASGTETIFWWKGNSTPPLDYDAWARLIKSAVKHWIERYGAEEVRRWYFEIWNEPDLLGFWHGTKSQYFMLYEVSVKAIKEIDGLLKVGGPATSNYVPDGRFDGETEDKSKQLTHLVDDLNELEWKGVWIEDFLKFAAERGLPVDFVSTHPYPTDFALDGHDNRVKGRSRKKDSLKEDIMWLRNVIAHSAYPDAEIHPTEWSSSPSSRDCSHDYLPAADYIVKSNLDCTGLADSLSYWVFTDIFEEAGPGPEPFHGGFGLMNIRGIKKPAWHAYRFLNQLGNTELGRGEEYIVTADEEGKLTALVYNYADACKDAIPMSIYPDRSVAEGIVEMGEEKDVHFMLTGLHPGSRFLLEVLDETHGNAMGAWGRMGYPTNLEILQEQELKYAGDSTSKIQLTANDAGILCGNMVIGKWALMMIKEL